MVKEARISAVLGGARRGISRDLGGTNDRPGTIDGEYEEGGHDRSCSDTAQFDE